MYPAIYRRVAPSVWGDIFNVGSEFDRVLRGLGAHELTSAWAPAVDVRETADEIEVDVELPGLNPADVDARVENGVLTVSGEKKAEIEEGKEGSDYHLVERRYGRFERSFTLPRSVQADRVEASFTNGVLQVRLPKTEAAKPRRIEIRPAEGGGNGRK